MKNKKYVVNKLSRKIKRKLLISLFFKLKLGSYRKITERKEARYKNKEKVKKQMQKDNLNNYSEDTVITNLIDFWQDLRWTKEMDSR